MDACEDDDDDDDDGDDDDGDDDDDDVGDVDDGEINLVMLKLNWQQLFGQNLLQPSRTIHESCC